MTNDKQNQKIPVIAPNELQDPFGQHDVMITVNNGNEDLHGVSCCARCGKPAHASETNDDDVCVECLGSDAIMPSDDDSTPELIDAMMYLVEGGDCSPGGRETTFVDMIRLFDVVVAQFNSGTMIAQIIDNENDGGRAFEMMHDTLDRFADAVFVLSSNRNERRTADKCRAALHAIGDALKAITNARKLTVCE